MQGLAFVSHTEAVEKGWEFDDLKGSMVLLRKLIYGDWDDDFLILEPGQTIKATYDDGVMEKESMPCTL